MSSATRGPRTTSRITDPRSTRQTYWSGYRAQISAHGSGSVSSDAICLASTLGDPGGVSGFLTCNASVNDGPDPLLSQAMALWFDAEQFLPMVHRCATCGGPLEGTEGRVLVRCMYCQCENRLVEVAHARALATSARLVAAAASADLLADELAARGEELRAAFVRESERAHVHGDREAAHAALRHLEGFLRLQLAPTIHVYRSMEPDDPAVGAALSQIDHKIDEAVAAAAASLGVHYRTTRERLGDPG